MSFLSLLKYIPFLRFATALAMGIYLAVVFEFDFSDALCFSLVASLFFLICVIFVPRVFKDYRHRWLPGLLFAVLLFQAGMILGMYSLPSRLKGEYTVEATAKVKKVDLTTSGYYRFTVKPLSVAAKDTLPLKPDDHWQIFLKPDGSAGMDNIRPGDEVYFRTRLSGHEEPTNPSVFNYGQYLYRQGVSASGFVTTKNFRHTGRSSLVRIGDRLRQVRDQVQQIYRKHGIKGENLQVLSALTLGLRDELTDEVRNRFVRSGAVHVLAVSGLHVGIIFLLLNSLTGLFFPQRSFPGVLIVVCGLVFFALLTGGSPSVFRAVVMLSVVQAGRAFRRGGNIYNLLGVSAFIILLVQPMSLFHAGFWLSHLAVAGIVTFFPVLREIYAAQNIFFRLPGDLAAVSLSAQLGTFPFSVFLFRAFPSWFLLANFLILPLVAPILVLAKLLIAFSEIPFAAAMFAGVLDDLLGFMNNTVGFLDSLPFAYLKGLWIGSREMVLLYGLIFLFGMWCYQNNARVIKYILIACTCLVISFNVTYLNKRNTDAFVVFDAGRDDVVGTIRSGEGLVLSSDEISKNHLGFITSGFFSENSLRTEEIPLFKDDQNHEIQVCQGPCGLYLVIGGGNVDRLMLEPTHWHEISGVVLVGEVAGNVAEMMDRLGCSRLIVSGGCPPWAANGLTKEVMKKDLVVHSISESGAYIDMR